MLSEESTVSSERLRVSRRKQMKPQHKAEGGKETNEVTSMSSDKAGGMETSTSGDGKLHHSSSTTTGGIMTPHTELIHTQASATCANETSDQQAYKNEKNNPIDLNTQSLSASNNSTRPMVSCINPMTDLTQHGEANCMEPAISQSVKRSVSDDGSEGMRSTENERMNSYHQSDMETDQEMNETDAVAVVGMSGSNQQFSDSDLMESGKELLAGKALEHCNDLSPRNRDKDHEEKEPTFNDALDPRLLKEISQSIASNQTMSQSKNSNIEESLRNDVNELKDQIRIIQHQYMYQAQRIQYLNLQLSLLAASHHQGALHNRDQQCQTPPLPRSASTNSNITIDKNIADHSSQIGSRNIIPKLQDFILAAAAQQGYSGTGAGGMTSQSNQPSLYGSGASVVDSVTKNTFPCIPASMMQQNKFLFQNEFANEARNGERGQECKSCSRVFKNESALQAHLISGTCQDVGPTQQNFISLTACSNQNLSTDEAVDKHELGGIGAGIEAETRGLNHGGRDSLVLQSNFKNDDDNDQHLMSSSLKLLPTSTHRKSEESSDGGVTSADKEDIDNDNFISTVFQNSISKNSLPGLSALRSMNFGRGVGAGSSGSELMSTSETYKLQELVEQIDKKKSLDKNECERPHKCDICSRAFTTRGNLRVHYNSVHRGQMAASSCSPVTPNLNSVTGTTVASGLECKLCRNRFSDQQSLQHHMQLHLLFSNQNQQQQQHEQVAQLFQKYNATEEGKRPHHGGYNSNSLFSMDFAKQRPSPTTSTAAAVTEQAVGSMYHNLLSNTENSDCLSPQSSTTGEPSITNSKDAAANPDIVDYQSENKPEKSTPLENQLEKLTASAAGFDETTAKNTNDENDDLCPNQIALDLTRPNPKESDEAGTSLQSASDPVKCETSSFTPTFLASNSLSALAQLASNSSLMRHDRLLPSHQLEFQSSSMQNEEVRNRKLAIACDICSKPFSCQSALDIHLRSHTKERPYKCRVCDRGFTTKGNLKQHLLTHNMTEVEDKMLDPVCSPKSFNQNSSVTAEQQKKTYVVGEKRHLENNGSQTAPDAKKNYPRHWCHVCQKQFSSASSLQIHNRTHTGEKPFACSVCGRAFTTKGNLKVHMGTHVWGAGGSRRGRRISMDNPLISPWMQNTAVTASSSHTPTNPQSLIRFPGPLADRAMFYQQYAALASRNFGVKPLYGGFNSLLPLGNTATSRLLMNSNNGQVNPLAPTSESVPTFNPNLLRPENSNKLAAQLIWKVCQRAQEQVN